MIRRRRRTRRIYVGSVPIGDGAPVAVQSMTKVHPRHIAITLRQIEEAAKAGCEIMRVAVPDDEAVQCLQEIRERSPLPLVADLHFNPRLALMVVEKGIEAIRVNPGTIRSRKRLREIFEAAKEKGVTVRVGINAGSLPRPYEERFGRTPEAMVACALDAVELAEEVGHRELKVSLKASDVPRTVEAYRLFSRRSDYPLHLGVTEAGPPFSGGIKSAVGLGILLAEGIGDTIRVSLTGDPVLEVRAAYHILRALGLRERGVDIISCPTCGRCEVDLEPMVLELERRLAHIDRPLTVAVMGCVVNGPGEAKEADVGIAGGKSSGVLFIKGRVVEKIPPEKWIERLVEEVERLVAEPPLSGNGGCTGPAEEP